MACFLPWFAGDLSIQLSEDVTPNVKKGKGREGIRGRQTKQTDAPSFIGSQIISEMFILIFMTLHVLTLFTFPICVATILTHLSFVPVKWNSSLLPTHAICFPP